jgi:hypothetical protein
MIFKINQAIFWDPYSGRGLFRASVGVEFPPLDVCAKGSVPPHASSGINVWHSTRAVPDGGIGVPYPDKSKSLAALR